MELEKLILEELSERPYRVNELARALGKHRQAVSRKLKELKARRYVQVREGVFTLTELGRARLAELYERRRHRLVYDHIIQQSLVEQRYIFLGDLPLPSSLRVRLVVDELLEEELRAGRIHSLWINRNEVVNENLIRQSSSEKMRSQTAEGIVRLGVNNFVWETLLKRLCYLAEEKIKDKDELFRTLSLNFRISISYEQNLLSLNEDERRKILELIFAALASYATRCYIGFGDADIIDALRLLVKHGYGSEEVVKLLEDRWKEGKSVKITKVKSHTEEKMRKIRRWCSSVFKKYGRFIKSNILDEPTPRPRLKYEPRE